MIFSKNTSRYITSSTMDKEKVSDEITTTVVRLFGIPISRNRFIYSDDGINKAKKGGY